MYITVDVKVSTVGTSVASRLIRPATALAPFDVVIT
ncbi:hypothetical protein GA0074692_2595 [Micromonospora pallida]|uniref:Uncharacterized protein n=1 Tax=Micromonospora pallida TaxID=145854 RepID=A0A1C6SH37_9ACTN|nr:hypothetical protein GA0074692_2595 [Micromonospora pallida]